MLRIYAIRANWLDIKPQLLLQSLIAYRACISHCRFIPAFIPAFYKVRHYTRPRNITDYHRPDIAGRDYYINHQGMQVKHSEAGTD